MPKIVKHNKVWCVRDGFTMEDKPEMVIQFWPIGRTPRLIKLADYTDIELTKNRYDYTLRVKAYDFVDILLTDGGKTKAIDTVIEPVPCPKVRKGMETRWYRGRWEKYLKTKGWVSI